MDYPAAHSMDTTWFALDRCGHVGVFHSGEEGAVPEGAPSVEGPFDADDLRPGELNWAFKNGILRPGGHDTAVSAHEERKTPGGGMIISGRIEGKGIVVHSAYGFFLQGPEASRDRILLQNKGGRQSIREQYYDLAFGATDGHSWFLGTLTSLAWNWLHSKPGLCLGCRAGVPVGVEERCRIHGLFTYHCSDYGNPPYRRGEAPSAPLFLDELNRRFDGRLPAAIPRFGKFCFGEKEVLQPIQWLPTRSYDYDDWVREDGQTVHREGPEDFPAAHSMDTDWFAVDRDGHVAVFESGQAGAVPKESHRGEMIRYDLADGLAGKLALTPTIFDLKGHGAPVGSWRIEHPSRGVHDAVSVILFVSSDLRFREPIASGSAVLLPSTEAVAVWCRTAVPAKIIEAVHDAGECIVCGPWWERHDKGAYQDVVDFGFFGYRHELGENWISAPYGRHRLPQQPVYADDLPADLRALVEKVTFGGLCFAREAHLQPVIHVPCESKQSAWLDFDGRTVRPIPGKEGEYADAYEILVKNADLDVRPPGSPGS